LDTFLAYIPYVVAAWLFLVGVYGIATSRNLIQLTICLGVVQSSTYVLLLAAGYRFGTTAPIFSDVPPGTPAADPVTHALVLTDIVVGATVSALLLAVCIQIQRYLGSLDTSAKNPLRNR
jgi:multicomponent Na+:H+ antiporter subunit C